MSSIQTMPMPLFGWPEGATGLGAVTSSWGADQGVTMDGSGDKLAIIFQARNTTCPDKVACYCSTHTSDCTIDWTIETLDSDGLPSGTGVSGSSTASVTIIATGVATSATGMKGTASLVAGTFYAIVGTQNGAGNVALRLRSGGSAGTGGAQGMMIKDAAGSWTSITAKSNSGNNFGCYNAAGGQIFIPGLAGAFTSAGLDSASSASSPNERGTIFQMPVACSVMGACGYWNGGSAYAATEDFAVNLYSSPSGTPSKEVALSVTNPVIPELRCYWLFATPFTIAANTDYCIAVESTNTGSISMAKWTWTNAGDCVWLYDSANFDGAYRAVSGNPAFTSDRSIAYGVFPIIGGVHDGVGGAGGVGAIAGVHGGIAG